MMHNLAMAGPFGKKYLPSKVPPLIVPPSLPDHFSKIFRIYEKAVTLNLLDAFKYISNNRDTIPQLYPHEIQEFLHISQPYEQALSYNRVTSKIVTSMIAKSHHSGFSHFELDLHGFKPLDHLCQRIVKNKRIDLTIIIRGEVGDKCCRFAKGGTYYIEKAKNYCGQTASAKFYVKEAEERCAFNAKPSTWYIASAGDVTARFTEGSTLNVNNVTISVMPYEKDDFPIYKPLGLYASTSRFHTPRDDVYQTLKNNDFRVRKMTQEQWEEKWAPAAAVFGRNA